MAVASRSSGGRRARMFEPEDEPAAARPWGDVADDSVDADITTQSSGTRQLTRDPTQTTENAVRRMIWRV